MRAENQVYVLRNAEGRHYIGLSHDPETRLQQHNNGQSSWTKRRGPWQLIWVSDKLSLSAARQLENRLKRQKGGHGLRHILDQSGS